LGINNAQLETTLAMRYGTGVPVGTLWEGDYDINVVLKSNRSDSSNYVDIQDEMIPVAGGFSSVPLRQVAQVTPTWENGQIVHRNGVRTITVMAEIERGANAMAVTSKIQEQLAEHPVSDEVTVSYGGELSEEEEQMPNIAASMCVAIIIIYFILVWHFRQVSTATMMLASLTLCLFGTALGIMIQGVDYGMTCNLGITSLMGILVRNGIIMIDYAEELRTNEHMCTRDAIYHSAKRRMRPIFLTSAAASMGVIPMILGGNGLWMPMGTAIFYGTLITMFFILTVIPVAYWFVLSGSSRTRAASEQLELE
jgi:multidrug efflux pump subunit AcrB